ncbi:MAG: hypothetical protein ABIH99_00350, partial [Candidatus Micrarchaeota archaeon]
RAQDDYMKNKTQRGQAQFAKGKCAALSGGSRKAQAAMELIILLSFILVVTIPAILLFYLSAGSQVNKASVEQANQAVARIAEKAEEVYLGGVGSVATVDIFLPPNTKNLEIREFSSGKREIVLTLELEGKETEMVRTINQPLSSIQSNPSVWGVGIHTLRLKCDSITDISVTYVPR